MTFPLMSISVTFYLQSVLSPATALGVQRILVDQKTFHNMESISNSSGEHCKNKDFKNNHCIICEQLYREGQKSMCSVIIALTDTLILIVVSHWQSLIVWIVDQIYLQAGVCFKITFLIDEKF